MVLQLFGIAKEIAGDKSIIIDTNLATVGELKHWLSNTYPALRELNSWAIAVDSEYAGDAKSIKNNSELALIPPVSGG